MTLTGLPRKTPLVPIKKYFVVVTPPRTRSTWLANFLSWGVSYCFHEALPEVSRVAELPIKFSNVPFSVVGMVDNGAAMFSNKLLEAFPTAAFAVITRPREEVARELAGLNLPT